MLKDILLNLKEGMGTLMLTKKLDTVEIMGIYEWKRWMLGNKRANVLISSKP